MKTPSNAANMANKANGHDQSANEPVFTIHNIYLKDLSFEAPQTPRIFNEPKVEWKPKLDFDLQMSHSVLSEAENIYEVVLHITATLKLGEGKDEKSVFLIEIQEGGVFTIQNLPEETINQVLATTCPTILFPYAREIITGLASKGGFPQLIVPPINFEAMYANHLASEGNNTMPLSEIPLA